ncbi:L,D-transpeptidase [Nocardioides ferulae]|uniref:L,D-transpeptidase n=1 Tax=Nocardioides ferulae TaxID=2340821 RepID=UPI000EAED9B1|nr:Ig-like domain-containing protein [Nocardioides ferulae]
MPSTSSTRHVSGLSQRTRRGLAAAATALLVSGLAACDAGSAEPGSRPGPDAEAGDRAAPEAGEPGKLRTNVRRGAQGVPVDRRVEVAAESATLRRVRVTSADGALPGELTADGGSWRASELLEPGTTYTIEAVGEGDDGERLVERSSFTTQALTLDQQTYPSVAPLEGETVGVGMPVIVQFDVAVTDRASIEEHLSVDSTPRQPGAWRWISDHEVHWRPKRYWQPGTQVSVDVDVNGVDAGAGIYGQEDRQVDFEVGSANIYRVDAQTHQMKVFSDGELLRTIPITTGKPGFTTRSGTKVIIEKFDSKRMNSETVGIPAGSAEAYDIDNVQWAMRVTYSGEFIHAAPWSVGSQGHANVSHGCTGLSTADAGWLYAMTKRGDVVEYTGTDRPMTLENGYGDWNLPFADYRRGSALS